MTECVENFRKFTRIDKEGLSALLPFNDFLDFQTKKLNPKTFLGRWTKIPLKIIKEMRL